MTRKAKLGYSCLVKLNANNATRVDCELDSDMLPVYMYTKSKAVFYVGRDDDLYKMCYVLFPGDSVRVDIKRRRYVCSRHVRTYSKYCKEYDKNVRFMTFDSCSREWKGCGIVPFTIYLIDKHTRKPNPSRWFRECSLYTKTKRRKIVHVDQQTLYSSERKNEIKLYCI